MNVLIVDDQERILEAVKSLVDWKRLGVEEVYTAESASVAKKKLETKSVDIMLTDIEMPGENGLGLHKWQKEHYPEITCIFLTSHADFIYAKEAIRNGAFDYILQPAAIPEIEETLGRCIEYLKIQESLIKKSSRYDERLKETLDSHVFNMFHTKNKFAYMEQWKADSGTMEEDWWYLPCLMEIWGNNSKKIKEKLSVILEMSGNKEEQIPAIFVCMDESRIGILFYKKGKIPDRRYLKEKMYVILQQLKEIARCELNLYVGEFSRDDLPEQIGHIHEFYTGKLLKRNEVYMVTPSEKQN